MEKQVIFNNNKGSNKVSFERNDLIFSQFHNNNLIESFRSKPSVTRRDLKETFNFNQHMLKQRDGLGHNYNNKPINTSISPDNYGNLESNYSNLGNNYSNFENNSNNYLDKRMLTDKNEKPKLVGIVNVDNRLPPNIYHNFSVSDRNTNKKSSLDYNTRNFRMNYLYKQ